MELCYWPCLERRSGVQNCGQGHVQGAGRWFSASISRAGPEGAWGQQSRGFGQVFQACQGGSPGLEEGGPSLPHFQSLPALL